jgi:hypothetical protein
MYRAGLGSGLPGCCRDPSDRNTAQLDCPIHCVVQGGLAGARKPICRRLEPSHADHLSASSALTNTLTPVSIRNRGPRVSTVSSWVWSCRIPGLAALPSTSAAMTRVASRTSLSIQSRRRGRGSRCVVPMRMCSVRLYAGKTSGCKRSSNGGEMSARLFAVQMTKLWREDRRARSGWFAASTMTTEAGAFTMTLKSVRAESRQRPITFRRCLDRLS